MKFATVLLLVATLLAVLLKRTTSDEIEEFKEVQKQITDDAARRIHLLTMRKGYKRTLASSSHSSPTCDSCSTPDSDNIVVVKRNKTLDLATRLNDSKHTKCAPYPMPVRLPIGHWSYVQLHYVSLHRCLGSVSFNSNHNYLCKASSKEEIHVQYYDYFKPGTNKLSEAVMYNHTSCTLECQEIACRPNKTFVRGDYCSCMCLISQSDCGPGTTLDPSTCECKCNVVTSCPVYKSFNKDTCKCECDQRIKDICTENNLLIDESLCRCKLKNSIQV